MFTVALTGGVASGKSEVARRFAERGVDVIDADVVARELVEPGMPSLAAIVARFGGDLLDTNGALDRRALRKRIFADATARAALEQILHPRIRDTLRERACAANAVYVMLAIPLLVESIDADGGSEGLVQPVTRIFEAGLAVGLLVGSGGAAPGDEI